MIVEMTRYHPALVGTIIYDYQLSTESIVIPATLLPELNALGVDWAFPIKTGLEVVQLLQKLAADQEKRNACTECETKTACLCSSCASLVAEPLPVEDRLPPPTEIRTEDAEDSSPSESEAPSVAPA